MVGGSVSVLSGEARGEGLWLTESLIPPPVASRVVPVVFRFKINTPPPAAPREGLPESKRSSEGSRLIFVGVCSVGQPGDCTNNTK